MSYKLYTYFRSSTAWRARIALNLKHIKPEYVYVNIFKGEQKTSQYVEKNPNQGVPTLELKDGTTLIESMAIIEYIDEVHPQNPKLFPGDAAKRAHIRGFCEVVNSGIHPYQNLRLLEKIEKEYKQDRAAFATYWVLRGMDTMEKLLARTRGKYSFGNEVTAADLFLYPQVINSVFRFKVDLKKYQNIQSIMANLKKIPQFVDSEPEKQADYEK